MAAITMINKPARSTGLVGHLSGRSAMLARLSVPALLVAPLLGCGILGLDSSGSCGGTGSSPCLSLRAVDLGALPETTLDASQQARREEVCQYLLQEQQAAGWRVVFTTQTPLGDIWDWVDATTVEGSDAVPPPALTLQEIQTQLAEGAQLQHMEIEEHPSSRGPRG